MYLFWKDAVTSSLQIHATPHLEILSVQLLLATYLFISFFYASLLLSKNPFQAVEIMNDFKSDKILNEQ